MSHSAPLANDAVEQWLKTQHHALVDGLRTALDLDVGLGEAMASVRHANLVADLVDVLDIEAGLSAIVPATPDATFEADSGPWWIEEWSWPQGRTPFPGLLPFDADQHRVFFGRSTEVDQLARLLRSSSECAEGAVLLVVGPSGCGKSSLVQAGLRSVMADEPGWWTLPPIVLGADPVSVLVRELVLAARKVDLDWTVNQVRHRLDDVGLTELAGELLQAAPGRRRRLLVVGDQFEQLLTQAKPAEQARFANLLRPALSGPVRMVTTLRSEFRHQLRINPTLAALPTHTFTLRPMPSEVLLRVIEEPARLAGICIDDGLASRLATDTRAGEALPLLACTLAQLVEGIGRGAQMSMARYEQLGGVRGVLIRQADAALADAIAAGGRGGKEVISGLLRLVNVDEQGRPAQRRVRRDRLPELVAAEWDAFIALRLLITDIETDCEGRDRVIVGLAHEAFLSAWSPFAEAITNAGPALRARRAIEESSTKWNDNNRPRSQLWSGGQLVMAMTDVGARIRTSSTPSPGCRGPLRWSRGRYRVLVTDHIDLSPCAHAFLHASIRRHRHRRRWVGVVLMVVPVLLVLTLITSSIAVSQQRAAQQASRAATARQLIVQAEVARNIDPRIALRLTVAAESIYPDGLTQSSLMNLLTSRYSGTLTGHTGPVNSVTFSPDGHILATASADQTTRLWGLNDPLHPTLMTTLIGHTGSVNSVVFSPSGRTLATASSDRTVRLWDVNAPHPTATAILTGYTGTVYTAEFSPDGHRLITDDYSRTVRVWDVSDLHHPTVQATLTGYPGTINAVAFSPDGHTLATAGGDPIVRLWDLTESDRPTLRSALTGHTGPVYGIAFAPDGRTLATASSDQTVRLWDLDDPRVARQLGPPLLTGYTYSIVGVAFAPDGRTLATASSDRAIRLWDLTTPAQPRPLEPPLTGQNGVARSVDFAPNGHILATGSDNATTILWDLNSIDDPRDHATERACRITAGGLNRDEWARYIPELPYQKTCPSS